ncbi:MAG TPA: hypothetical protein VN709_04845 [Terriglobales bacterium]|nr:hypothetical protein [Terriglobales bacterium]
MKHALARIRTHVEHGAVTAIQLAPAGDFGGRDLHVAEQRGVSGRGGGKIRDVALGDDQYVCRCSGLDVFECEDLVILKHLPGRNLARDHPAE